MISILQVRKESLFYDLPFAIGILAADDKVQADRLESFVLMGELSLDGTLQPVKGKRALEVAAAGGHNLVMIESLPAPGKTMLAKRIPTIIQPLTLEK